MGSAVCSPLVEIWDITIKPAAPDSLELSNFPKARQNHCHLASDSHSVSSFSIAEVYGGELSLAISSPDVGSSTVETKITA